jgi:hypothetical protein
LSLRPRAWWASKAECIYSCASLSLSLSLTLTHSLTRTLSLSSTIAYYRDMVFWIRTISSRTSDPCFENDHYGCVTALTMSHALDAPVSGVRELTSIVALFLGTLLSKPSARSTTTHGGTPLERVLDLKPTGVHASVCTRAFLP